MAPQNYFLEQSVRRATGFSLLEVLIALLVLSLGLLGLAALQVTSLKFNTESYYRTQATFLAYDIIDRMRANPLGRANYIVADQTAAVNKISSYRSCDSDSTCKCSGGTACSYDKLALYDLGKWYDLQEKMLAGAKERRATINFAANQFTITIYWKERDKDDVLKEQTWVVQL